MKALLTVGGASGAGAGAGLTQLALWDVLQGTLLAVWFHVAGIFVMWCRAIQHPETCSASAPGLGTNITSSITYSCILYPAASSPGSLRW